MLGLSFNGQNTNVPISKTNSHCLKARYGIAIGLDNAFRVALGQNEVLPLKYDVSFCVDGKQSNPKLIFIPSNPDQIAQIVTIYTLYEVHVFKITHDNKPPLYLGKAVDNSVGESFFNVKLYFNPKTGLYTTGCFMEYRQNIIKVETTTAYAQTIIVDIKDVDNLEDVFMLNPITMVSYRMFTPVAIWLPPIQQKEKTGSIFALVNHLCQMLDLQTDFIFNQICVLFVTQQKEGILFYDTKDKLTNSKPYYFKRVSLIHNHYKHLLTSYDIETNTVVHTPLSDETVKDCTDCISLINLLPTTNLDKCALIFGISDCMSSVYYYYPPIGRQKRSIDDITTEASDVGSSILSGIGTGLTYPLKFAGAIIDGGVSTVKTVSDEVSGTIRFLGKVVKVTIALVVISGIGYLYFLATPIITSSAAVGRKLLKQRI